MPRGDAITNMADVNLRTGAYGRLECTVNDEDYYLQWYPCWMQEMKCPPELTLAFMDAIGVDMAVLQHDHVYGGLNTFLSAVMHRYRGRFLPLAQIDAWESDQEAQAARLEHAVQSLGLKGLYFEVEIFALTDWSDHLDDLKFEPIWRCVQKLNIPIFWYLYTSARDRFNSYMYQVGRLDRWAKAHPDISSVYTHGLETVVMLKKNKCFEVPSEVLTCLKNPNVYLEVMLHLMALDTEYPFYWAQEMLKRFYDVLGPEKLLWGSDMPAAERNVTYRQAMD